MLHMRILTWVKTHINKASACQMRQSETKTFICLTLNWPTSNNRSHIDSFSKFIKTFDLPSPHLANLIIPGKSVEVKHSKHHCLLQYLAVRNLQVKKLRFWQKRMRNNLEFERFLKYRVKSPPVNFCLKLFIFLRKEVDLHIRIGRSSDIHHSEILQVKGLYLYYISIVW